jgi:thioredoxin reductase (NADPH)
MTKNNTHARLIILGSGPAGYSAAVYAARANLNPVLISGLEVGGQLMQTTEVDNWIGGKENLQGPELMADMQQHALRSGVEMINDYITKADLSNKPFTLTGSNGQYTCDSLIIATGATAKKIGLPSEEEFAGRGVSACATCDGFFYKNQKVAVIGGGNTAVEEALYLANIASHVTLIHRKDTLRAEKVLQDKLFKKQDEGKVNILWNHQMLAALGDATGVNGIQIKNLTDESTTEIALQGIFIAIGHTPNTGLFVNQLNMTHGYIDAAGTGAGAATATNIPGVFVAGDVADSHYRQAITSAGSGCMAALDAEKYLDQ